MATYSMLRVLPGVGTPARKGTAAFGDPHSSTLRGSSPPAHAPCLHAGRLSPPSCPWHLIILLSKLESKTNRGLPGPLGRGFCSAGQETGQQAAAPSHPLPRGAPSRARGNPTQVPFCTVLLASGATRGQETASPSLEYCFTVLP